MRKFLGDLIASLDPYCPTFLTLPPDVPYPHITLEGIRSLSALPLGPTALTFELKIWSRYAGPKEILIILKQIESLFHTHKKGQFKIIKSFLAILPHEEKRVHTLHVKARIPYERD
jgi:hypothetical protein